MHVSVCSLSSPAGVREGTCMFDANVMTLEYPIHVVSYKVVPAGVREGTCMFDVNVMTLEYPIHVVSYKVVQYMWCHIR